MKEIAVPVIFGDFRLAKQELKIDRESRHHACPAMNQKNAVKSGGDMLGLFDRSQGEKEAPLGI